MLDKFAEELREARDKSGVTLHQMSVKTRIDIKFLEALDRGDFSFMPEPYVKAFLKEYAKMVGLDETKIISKFEAAKKGKVIDENEKQDQTAEKPVSVKKTYDAAPSEVSSQSSENKNRILFWGAAAAVVILLVIYLVFFKNTSDIVIAEKPFDEVIGENKDRFVENKNETLSPGISLSDSISLYIFASDTSWVKIILDDKQADEFILFPNSQKQIKAINNYKITLGNSGGIRFQLNDKPLNFEGKPGAIQHVQIDRDGLKALQSPPTLELE